MSQVIYRRGWCPHCGRETIHRARQTVDTDGSVSHELVDCTECQRPIGE
jgi:predicted RNA-binding Zn-ribbon protein involved in translation (DUF1610 family)